VNLAKMTVPRPVATAMFFLCVLLLGGIAFMRIPVDLLPDVTYPRLTVATEYEDVGPEEIEQLVTRPIERAVASIQGVESVDSVSGEGMSQVMVAFTWGTNLDAAAEDIRTSLDRIRNILPEAAETPRVFKFDFADFPILFLGVSSELDLSALAQFLEDRVKYRLERVPGVAATDVFGARKKEIQVKLDLERVHALRVTPQQVVTAIAAENINSPAGAVNEGSREILIRTEGEYANVDEIGDTVVVERAEGPVRVRDVGAVSAGLAEERTVVRINGEAGVMLFVRKQAGANTVDVAKAVLEEIVLLNRDYPQIHIRSIMDTSRFIRDAIQNVEHEAIIGAGLALLILLLFLRSIASSLVIATSIPLSVIATFALIYFSGYTLNVMTFGGLALGVGLLVDNSIVVLENIYRRLELGDSPRTAAINGAGEVSDAIAASTLTTIAVFIPLAFFTGLPGVLFRQLAAVVAFSLICSLVAAAALVPTLCALLFRWERPKANNDRTNDRMSDEYERALRFSLSHPRAVMCAFLVLVVGSVALAPRLGFELMPAVDEGIIRVNFDAEVGTHLKAMKTLLARFEGICTQVVPELDTYFGRVGANNYRVTGGNEGRVRLSLVPKTERNSSSEEVAAVLRQVCEQVPGVVTRVRPDSGTLMRVASRGGGGDKLSIEVRGFDLRIGAALAKQVARLVENVPGVTDTEITREEGRPELVCRIDRAKAASHGLSFKRVADELNTFLAGTTATQFRDHGDEYGILIRLEEPDRNFIEKLATFPIITPSGDRVFIRSLLSFERRSGPVTIERLDQQRVNVVQANFADRALGSVATDIRKVIASLPLPKGFEIHLGGEVEEQEKAYAELGVGLLMAILLVYMVMAAQFESFSSPFIIMFTMPMAVIGVVALLLLTHTPISINGFMGIIMLAGIVVNDAIVLVDATIKIRRARGAAVPLETVLIEAGRRRLRPVLMTTFTTALALSPIAIGLGEGAEIQSPMARVVIGGLISGTFITLVVVPLVYRSVDRIVTSVFGPFRYEEDA